MRVHPEFQKRGFGTAILLRLESQAISVGYHVLHLDTVACQVAAEKLYSKHGYREVGRKTGGSFEIILYEKNCSEPQKLDTFSAFLTKFG